MGSFVLNQQPRNMIAYTIISLLLLVASIFLAYTGILWGAGLCGIVVGGLMVYGMVALSRSKANVVTVLKAVQNQDFSFSLKDDDTGINRTLNQIKDHIRRIQKEVVDRELFLSIIIDRVPTGVIIATPEGTVRFINHAALTLLGLPVLTHLHRLRQVYPELYETLSAPRPPIGGEGTAGEVTIQTEKEVRELTVEHTVAELQDGSARIITLIDTGSRLDQKETDSWMSLIRVMTHEIMNSVAPIRSISEVLLEDTRDPVHRGAVQTIRDTSDNLIRFVEDYRKFSSVPQPRHESIDLERLLAQTKALFETELRERSIALRIEFREGVKEVRADSGLLMQVLLNLLKNALQAVPDGGKIALTADRGSAGRPILLVYNSGTPIPDEVRPYIFVPFFTTKEGGSGIGLSLSQYIMRLHGGNLRYLPGSEGSTFVLEF